MYGFPIYNTNVLFGVVYGCITFFKWKKYIFSCIHHARIKSNDKLIAVEVQILDTRLISSETWWILLEVGNFVA